MDTVDAWISTHPDGTLADLRTFLHDEVRKALDAEIQLEINKSGMDYQAAKDLIYRAHHFSD